MTSTNFTVPKNYDDYTCGWCKTKMTSFWGSFLRDDVKYCSIFCLQNRNKSYKEYMKNKGKGIKKKTKPKISIKDCDPELLEIVNSLF